jgi:hypothetical protein
VKTRPPGITTIGKPLVEDYERLRCIAVGSAETHRGRGLALLMRKGLAAWMQAWSDFQATPAARPNKGPPPFPENQQLDLVTLLTEMAVATAMETAS